VGVTGLGVLTFVDFNGSTDGGRAPSESEQTELEAVVRSRFPFELSPSVDDRQSPPKLSRFLPPTILSALLDMTLSVRSGSNFLQEFNFGYSKC